MTAPSPNSERASEWTLLVSQPHVTAGVCAPTRSSP